MTSQLKGLRKVLYNEGVLGSPDVFLKGCLHNTHLKSDRQLQWDSNIFTQFLR